MHICALLVAGSRTCRETGARGTASVPRPMPADDDSQTGGPVACAPCRGTGSVISNLGGEPSHVRCPWCEGGGTQIPGHDAQAHERAGAAE
ncbi:MAG: hypothetical protein QOD83_2567 [Solirubrobacteraceae bacterium]|jgi:DnaJ-class molecular chaperone|nr:hypothetical protein [Solirubrobacteraceae bacterium]